MPELTIEEAKSLIKKYEENGSAKLYYAMQRKAWEMADLLNAHNLRNLDIDDPKSKTFDRLKVIWQDAASLATGIKTLGEVSGITGDETKDVSRKKYTSPESVADVLGNSAGQIN